MPPHSFTAGGEFLLSFEFLSKNPNQSRASAWCINLCRFPIAIACSMLLVLSFVSSVLYRFSFGCRRILIKSLWPRLSVTISPPSHRPSHDLGLWGSHVVCCSHYSRLLREPPPLLTAVDNANMCLFTIATHRLPIVFDCSHVSTNTTDEDKRTNVLNVRMLFRKFDARIERFCAYCAYCECKTPSHNWQSEWVAGLMPTLLRKFFILSFFTCTNNLSANHCDIIT